MIDPTQPQMGMAMPQQQVPGMGPDEFILKLHSHPLKRQTLAELKKTTSGHGSGVSCKGTAYYGCRTWKKQQDIERNDPNDIVYHCADCEYDLCERCFYFYGNKPHGHPLERMRFAQAQKIHGIDYTIWCCDKVDDRKDCTKKHISDNNEFVFHCKACDFTICSVCYETFKKF